MAACLEDFRISGLPSAIYYIPNFINENEEKVLLEKIASVPKPRWKQLSHRRLQSWPSELHNDTLLGAPLPNWLNDPVIPRLLSYRMDDNEIFGNVFSDSPHHAPNHVLINEYLPGQGIMPHKDGSAYHPVVCTVSLGGSLCLDLYGCDAQGVRDAHPRWKVLQEPRSLLVTTKTMYSDYLHGIQDTLSDMDLTKSSIANWDQLGHKATIVDGPNMRTDRTSLTYRDVLKVSAFGRKFALFGKK